MSTQSETLKQTPLTTRHQDLGAKMVPFAGYDMPVQYPLGVLAEHRHTRAKAGLFDVSHMGQIAVTGADAVAFLQSLLPTDVQGLAAHRQVYSLLLNADGGILDDLMLARFDDHFVLIVNAACKHTDLAVILAHAENYAVSIEPQFERGLLALQGPAARHAMASLIPAVAELRFMDVTTMTWQKHRLWLSCSGYTGEDGFEISGDAAAIAALFDALLAVDAVEPVGLGARDSLRLEAGLCLYGHDMDTQRTPVEAALSWAIAKSRRTGAEQEGGFPGSSRVLSQLRDGSAQRRVLLDIEGRAPLRESVSLCNAAGATVGVITSGGFGPSVGAPVAMGYVDVSALEHALFASLRGKQIPVSPRKGPYITPGYVR